MAAAGLAGRGLTSCESYSKQDKGEAVDGKLTFRTNQHNSDKVGILGYGCMRWPMTKDKDGNDIVDQEVVNQLVKHAIDSGINYFDTAPVYLQGLSEKATALALSQFDRSSYFLATKLSNFSNYSRENSLKMYRKSFENLRTDYIDYYLLHAVGGGGMENFNARYVNNGMLDFLMEERKAGRIRNLGFSFHGDKDCFDSLLALHDKYHWDFIQIQLNYMDWKHAGKGNTNAEYLYAAATALNIPLIIMEPLLGGRLADVPSNIETRLKGREPRLSIASWAFRFAGSHDNILCVLSGMRQMEHLQDNLHTYSPLVTLTPQEKDFLEETAVLIQRYPLIPCNDCKYCMPCPYGIDIPAILLHYNKCLNENNIIPDQTSEEYRKARRAYLVGYNRTVAKERQADHCIGCRQCMHHCPQHINIPKEIRKIDSYTNRLKLNQPI